jgi:hypothetical protein
LEEIEHTGRWKYSQSFTSEVRDGIFENKTSFSRYGIDNRLSL